MNLMIEELCTLIKREKPTFVIFYAPWCPHCQKMMPIIRKWEKNPDLMIKYYNIDDTRNTQLIKYCHIQSVPLMIFYRADEPLWRINGEIEEKELSQTIYRLLKK